MELAEKLGRTLEELLYGSACFRPLSNYELMLWVGLWKQRILEEDQRRVQAKLKGRKR